MNLLYLSNDVPLWLLTLLLVLVACGYAGGLMLGTRFRYGVDRLSLNNNQVAGFKFAVVGVFYAVLLAFVVVAVWEDFRQTEATVRDESEGGRRHRITFALPAEAGDENPQAASSPTPRTCANTNGPRWPWASRATSWSRTSIG